VPKQVHVISVLIACSLWNLPQAVYAQALIPHTIQLDPAKLEQQGLGLAQEAVQLAQLQQIELAIPRARLATQLVPRNEKVWLLLGSLELQNKDFVNASAALKKSVDLNPKNPDAFFALGSSNFQQKKYQASISDYLTGLKLNPHDPEARFDLGNTYYLSGNLPEAIAQFSKAVTEDKKFWPAVNNIGLIKYEQGHTQEAIKQWQSAISLDKQAAEPRLALGIALYTKGQHVQGVQMAQAALKIDRRYADLDFLKDNLWGDRLLADAKPLLELPAVQNVLKQDEDSPNLQSSESGS